MNTIYPNESFIIQHTHAHTFFVMVFVCLSEVIMIIMIIINNILGSIIIKAFFRYIKLKNIRMKYVYSTE